MLKNPFKFVLVLLVTFQSSFVLCNETSTPFSARPEVQKFIQTMSQKHNLNKNELLDLFNTFTSEPKIIQTISKPFEAMPWYRYRENFVTEDRAKKGAIFWKNNEALLKKAEEQFGVPAEIIVAIIGVETRYGQNTGKYPVVQSLATLAFDYPPRASFFLGELEQFLLLAHEEHLNAKTIYGSYAGAMGIPQFMPSSYRRFAVDFSGKGKKDLMNDMGDAIASVANYFKMHGWKSEEPIIYKATVTGNGYLNLEKETKSKELKPKRSLTEFAEYGIQPEKKLIKNGTQPATYITLENSPNTNEHWLGLYNFYVITRYNHSINYAMAVYQLSQQIRLMHQQSS